MKEFIGREKELKLLKDCFNNNSFEFIVIYGRRRIGKTTLIEKAIGEKKSIFFQATSNTKYNLSELSYQASLIFNELKGLEFKSYKDFFHFISIKTKEEPIIIAIDEISYIAEADKSFLEVLQKFVDHEFKETKLKLVLAGSYVHFMESNILGPQSPLFGRRTLSIKLQPFSLKESAAFVSLMSYSDKAIVHIITGGVASYLTLFGRYKSAEEAIKALYFDTMGVLFNEQRVLLSSSVRAVENYELILSCIAGGTNRVSLIADKIGLDKANVSSLLSNLKMMGIVDELYSIAPKEKKIGWVIKDGYYAFYYAFIFPNKYLIERNLISSAFSKTMELLPSFIGRRIEEDFRYYVLEKSQFLPLKFGFAEFPNPNTKANEEVDLFAINREGEVLIGESKWKNEKVDKSILLDLHRKALLLGYTNCPLYVLAKEGFSDNAKAMANENSRYHLIEGSELFQ